MKLRQSSAPNLNTRAVLSDRANGNGAADTSHVRVFKRGDTRSAYSRHIDKISSSSSSRPMKLETARMLRCSDKDSLLSCYLELVADVAGQKYDEKIRDESTSSCKYRTQLRLRLCVPCRRHFNLSSSLQIFFRNVKTFASLVDT